MEILAAALLLMSAFASVAPATAEVCTPPIPDLQGETDEPVCDTDLPICEEGVEGACGEEPPEPCDPTPGGKVPGDYPACPTPPLPCAPEGVEQPWEECQPAPDPCPSGCDPGPICEDEGECDVGPEPPCEGTECAKDPPVADCEDKAYPVVCDDGECDNEGSEGANAAGGLCDDPCDAPENPCDPSDPCASGCDPCHGDSTETPEIIADQPAIGLNENLTDCGIDPVIHDPCESMGPACEEDPCAVPIGVPNLVACCINTQGEEVAWGYLQPHRPGQLFEVWVLEEMVAGTDGQIDIRVGWNNQHPQSKVGETITFKSSNDWEQAPWGQIYNPTHIEVFDGVRETAECGLFMRPTYGTHTNPALIDVEAHFSGIVVEVTESRSTTNTTSTHYEASTTTADTWEVSLEYEYNAMGGSGGGGYTQTFQRSETDTYGGSDSVTYQEGNTVTWTSTRSDFVMHMQPVG